MLLKLEGIRFTTFLDLSMGYYYFQLNPNALWLCTIILTWGKCEYFRLPMGVSVALNIFQENTLSIPWFEHIKLYVDDVLLTTKDDWENHLVGLGRVLLHSV